MCSLWQCQKPAIFYKCYTELVPAENDSSSSMCRVSSLFAFAALFDCIFGWSGSLGKNYPDALWHTHRPTLSHQPERLEQPPKSCAVSACTEAAECRASSRQVRTETDGKGVLSSWRAAGRYTTSTAKALAQLESEKLSQAQEKNTRRCRPFRWIERDLKFDHSQANSEKASDKFNICSLPENIASQAAERAHRPRPVDDL